MNKKDGMKAALSHAIKAKRRELWATFIDGGCVSVNLVYLLISADRATPFGGMQLFSIAIIAWCMVAFLARIRSNNRAYARMMAKVEENGNVDG